MTRGMRFASLAFVLALTPSLEAASTATGTPATASGGVSVVDSTTACSDSIKLELSEAVGAVSLFDVSAFESAETQETLLSFGTVGPKGPPNFPATGACGGAYGADTDGCDACCGRLWGKYVRWCGTQPNCQACQDQAREWRRQCEQGCVDVATWTYPGRCAEVYAGHADCFNCCVTAVNDMNRWCELAYPNDRDKRLACKDDVSTWTLSCLSACPQ